MPSPGKLRRALRYLGWTLVSGGALVLTFLAYQLVGTDILNSRSQAEARAELSADLELRRRALPTVEVVSAPAAEPEATLPETEPEPDPEPEQEEVSYQREMAGQVGTALGRMTISAIEMDEVMFTGVDRETLKKGPGHMPGTPVPGQPGNAVVSGHRTTYGRPFFSLDELDPGDRIEVETALGPHIYAVRDLLIVAPTDVWVTDQIPGAWLTLTTCHPLFSAAERLIVRAELVEGPNRDYADLLGGDPRRDLT